MENYHLYIITNLVNQKKYVGITKVGFQARFEKHLLNAQYFYHRYQNKVLYLAIRKHGCENFSVKFLAEGDDWNHLCQIEVIAIKEYNTFIDDGCGYNMTRGGDGTDGYKFTEEQLAKRTERGLSEEHKANIKKNNARYWLGKHHIPKTIAKIKKARAKQVMSEEFKEGARQRWTGAKNPRAKAVMIGNVRYETLKSAADAMGKHPETISQRIRNPNFPEHKWADK